MLLHRIITSVVLFVLLILTVLYFPVNVVAIVIALLIGSGLWEFYTMVENKGLQPYKIYGVVGGSMLTSATYLAVAKKYTSNEDGVILVVLFVVLVVALVKYAFKKDGSSVIINSAVTLLGILYVSFLFTFIIKLRYINPAKGAGWVMSLFVITKMSDVSAFFCGSKWGKHKLIPRISAKKSVEGAIASVVGAMLTSLLLRKFYLEDLSWSMAAILGALLGGIGQIGDLVESLMKRDANVKDSGKFVPGLGGVLDFMDSLLFTGPFMYLYFIILKIGIV